MKRDIRNLEDIKLLVNSFYDKVKVDEFIGGFFTEVIAVDWEKHLPIMYAFWENVLFHTGSYNGNPMQQHMSLHKKSAMQKYHFDRWLSLFNETVDELFEGNNAIIIKQRALSIATVMQTKMIQDMP
jgi:hemoglobin